MAFGIYNCPYCHKRIDLGMVAPNGVMNRHHETAGCLRAQVKFYGGQITPHACPECGSDESWCWSAKGNKQRFHKGRLRVALRAAIKAARGEGVKP